jgi:hypothetical protein
MTVPYSAWTFKKSPGKVHAVAYQGRFDFELNFLMNNAIIIEDIVAAIKVIQTQAK